VLVTATAVATALSADDKGDKDKGKKPHLELRVVPRMAFSPVTAFFTAELVGGSDVEEFYCPELEWEWDDGGKSVQESDCPAYTDGAKIERRFTAEHEYRKAGTYNVRVTLRRSSKNLVAQTVRVTVRPGLGDNSQEQGQ
jgi:hypothetical protein